MGRPAVFPSTSTLLRPALLMHGSLRRHQAVTFLVQRNSACSQNRNRTQCASKATASLSLSSAQFWSSIPVWKRAGINTLRCLIGCTAGDFSAMWYLLSFHADFGLSTIMALSMTSGIATSLLLETALLRLGRDRLSWVAAAKTATGMSMISMVTMEAAENAVDFHLTGGMVQFDSPAFWSAAIISVAAGFLAPLPYNYIRLKKYGKSCH